MKKKTKGVFYYQRKLVGKEIIAEFFGCQKPPSVKNLRKILVKATKMAKANLILIKIHKFPNGGLTAFALLSESHISLHYWQEISYCAIDIFTCGKANPLPALKIFKKEFSPKKIKIIKLKRGER